MALLLARSGLLMASAPCVAMGGLGTLASAWQLSGAYLRGAG